MNSTAGSREAARPRRVARFALAAVTGLALVACTPVYRNHGYAPTEIELSAVEVGRDTRETVEKAIGRPSASGLLNDNQWFYVQSRYRQRGPRAPEEIERQVVVITFAEAGTVSNVERFGLEDGNVVALSRRVTETNIQGVSFIKQILGNFGRLTADQLLE